MNMKACEKFADKLVDYADGELSMAESPAVAEHVAVCPRCRETVAALRESMHLARVIWQEGESDLAGIQMPVLRSRVVRLRRPAIAAAVILLVSAGALVWRQAARPNRPDVPDASAAMTTADIQVAVGRAGAAAGLVKAAEYLAEQPGGEEMARERLHYVVQTYPETQGAAQARARLRSHVDERG